MVNTVTAEVLRRVLLASSRGAAGVETKFGDGPSRSVNLPPVDSSVEADQLTPLLNELRSNPLVAVKLVEVPDGAWIGEDHAEERVRIMLPLVDEVTAGELHARVEQKFASAIQAAVEEVVARNRAALADWLA